MGTRAAITEADVAFWDKFGEFPDEAITQDIAETSARGVDICAVLPQSDLVRVGHAIPAPSIALHRLDGTTICIEQLTAQAAQVGSLLVCFLGVWVFADSTHAHKKDGKLLLVNFGSIT
jgi:hypothetical protein